MLNPDKKRILLIVTLISVMPLMNFIISSYPICRTHHNYPQTTISNEKTYSTANISPPNISLKQITTATKENNTKTEQEKDPFTDPISWVCWLFSETVRSPEKIFTSLIAFFTLILAVFTFALYWNGRGNAKKELRAYVAMEDMFFRWIAAPSNVDDRSQIVQPIDGNPVRPRIRIKNFGYTPANNVMVRINGLLVPAEVDKAMNTTEIKFDKVYERKNYPTPRQMLAPTQKYGVWVHLQGNISFNPHEMYDPSKKVLAIYGAIIYEDIYKRWWVTRFCYIYDGKNRFLPYIDYNYEEEYPSEDAAKDSLSYV